MMMTHNCFGCDQRSHPGRMVLYINKEFSGFQCIEKRAQDKFKKGNGGL